MMEATKRPWLASGRYISGDEDMSVAECDNSLDATLIVRAVNTFDQAREALKTLSNEVSALLGLEEEELRDLVGHSNVECLKERLSQAKGALAAMEAPHE